MMSLRSEKTLKATFTGDAQRVVAWVDGVGAFLICLPETLTIGGLSGRADVRMAANLLGEHARIKRSGEGYVLEAVGTTLLARVPEPHSSRRGSGRIVEGSTDLSNGDELVLFRDGSEGVRLRFRRPNELTSTAALSIASDHRTEPRYDGIIMLGEACVLGKKTDSHISCRDSEGAIVLFRRDGGLWCRAETPLSLNGSSMTGPFQVHSGGIVEGCGVSFRLEAVE